MYNKLKKPLEFLDKISRGFWQFFQLYFVYIFKYNERRKNPKNHSKGGKNGREKVFNKEPFCKFLLAIAMVLTLLPIGAVQAKAEEAAVKLYFELPDGTTVTDWGVNVWTDAKVSNGDTEHAFRPSTWGTGEKYPTLLADETNKGWGYVVISGTIDGLQFVNKAGKPEYKCWNAQIANEGHEEAYFDPSVEKWYTSAEKQ